MYDGAMYVEYEILKAFSSLFFRFINKTNFVVSMGRDLQKRGLSQEASGSLCCKHGLSDDTSTLICNITYR